MGAAASKDGENEALALCSERTILVRHAVELRFSLSAAHLSYIQSLRSLGIALRRFASAELAGELSLSNSDEQEKSPSPSSLASPGEDKNPNWDIRSDNGGDLEREDPSEFITHRAKEFLSSLRDLEREFLRAADCGEEISRMLEARKIQLASKKDGSSPGGFLAALQVSCFKSGGAAANLRREKTAPRVAKVIAWNRSASWASSASSSSSKKTLKAAVDFCDDSGVDFCMLSGSHSSTLDRLYAWERKLYDEVKASEEIKREYEQRCSQLGQRAAKNLAGRAVDRARAATKDLHSQLRVAINSVDSISKRIEILRDEELFPQLMELIDGWSRMWKSMLECHHAQFITISLAYHARMGPPRPPAMAEDRRCAADHLCTELEFFGFSFQGWVAANQAYAEALFAWLQKGIILPPPGRGNARRRAAVFSPRRAVAPPIFVLCRDWLTSAKAIPSGELVAAIAAVAADLVAWCRRQEDGTHGDGGFDHHHQMRMGLARVFDRLSKFSELSLKAYEDIRQAGNAAQAAYVSARTRATKNPS